MVALVERGTPRDFRYIHAVCEAGLITPPGNVGLCGAGASTWLVVTPITTEQHWLLKPIWSVSPSIGLLIMCQILHLFPFYLPTLFI